MADLEFVSVLIFLQLLDKGCGGSHGCEGHIYVGAAQALLQDTVEGAHELSQGWHYVVSQLGKDQECRLYLGNILGLDQLEDEWQEFRPAASVGNSSCQLSSSIANLDTNAEPQQGSAKGKAVCSLCYNTA